MGRILAALGLILLLGCAEEGSRSGAPADFTANSGPLSGKYVGPDSGYLILALTAKAGTSYTSYEMRFRRRDGTADSAVWWGQGNWFDQRKLDIADGTEKGIVDVRRLPPGDYEIFNFAIGLNGGTVQSAWRSKADFSIPFAIAPGRASYVGEFMAVKMTGENIFGMTVPNGAYFVLSDKMERDAVIARNKQAALGEITKAVVDPNTLGNPLISASVR